MADFHKFEMVLATPTATTIYTEEFAKSLVGQTVPVKDGLPVSGGFSVETAAPYQVIDAWLDDDGRVVARLQAEWGDDDPRMRALQRVRRFMASGEFERRFWESFDQNLPGYLKRSKPGQSG